MKEVLCFVLGIMMAFIFIKSTGIVMHIGAQDLICYPLRPLPI